MTMRVRRLSRRTILRGIGGIAVALVSFADTSVLSRTYAARLRTPVNPNQEMFALGAANRKLGARPTAPVELFRVWRAASRQFATYLPAD